MKKTKSKVTALKVWAIIFAALFVFAFVVTLVLTQNSFLYYTISSTSLGGSERYLKSGDPSEYMYYKADYGSKAEVLSAANALNERIVDEGIVLLKNEGNALPLKGKNITVLGKNSVNPVYGGTGSNQDSGTSQDEITDLYEGLESAGFNCNPAMKTFYNDKSRSGNPRPVQPEMGDEVTGFPTAETPVQSYGSDITGSFSQYDDAAIVFLSRIGGEGFDLPRTMFWNGKSYADWSAKQSERKLVDGAESMDSHYLELDKNEKDLLKLANDNFDNVIVVFNSPSAMELGFLKDGTYPNVRGALWLGCPGNSGMSALGRVLSGAVDPSGRLVDTFSADFTKDPSWYNFANNLQADGHRYTRDGSSVNAWFVEYREGIYTGYRYYETRGYTAGEDWYKQNVVYPFGYGLSYTQFDYSVTPSAEDGATLEKDGKLSFEVDVTNVGDYDGKEVVQLYYSAPYTEGGIEKSHVVLGDFAKTDVLEKGGAPGKVTLELDVRDMASYDYSDANGNGVKGYELDSGVYTIYITDNAHGWADENVIKFTYTVPETEEGVGFVYENDDATNAPVNNLFDDVSSGIAQENYLSRKDDFANFENLKGASEASYRDRDRAFTDSLTYRLNDKEGDPWYANEAPEQSKRPVSYSQSIKLYELIGKPYNDELWNKFMDQLTVDQMVTLISTGNFRTLALENVDKPLTTEADGPMGFALFMGDDAVYDTCYYASECVLAATFNKDLAYEMGKMVGNEGLIGNERDGNERDGVTPYSGWYAPAMNIHRSPFGGRNFEYYSEDGYLSGVMASNVAKAAKQKGLYTFAKHFALNEQETKRDYTGLVTWANEQSMREIYFKPFEMSVKDGGITALMTAFNRIGVTWTGGSYPLLTQLLREEWGFEGMVITDFNLKSYMNADQMIRAGGDLSLSPGKSPSSTSTPTDIANIRRAVKNIMFTVANSCAMNGHGANVIWAYTTPVWVIWLIVVDCVLFVAAAAFGTVILLKKFKPNIFKIKSEVD